MPRSKTKSCPNDSAKRSKKTGATLNPHGENDIISKVQVKTETSQDIADSLNKSVPDLSMFRFEKRPPVKIEFDSESPVKEVS